MHISLKVVFWGDMSVSTQGKNHSSLVHVVHNSEFSLSGSFKEHVHVHTGDKP